MYYPEELIEEVRTRNDIVEVISGYVRLQKKGSNYFGLCPFHNEKSPSFSVSPGKQMYYCFGCGAGGNVITFLMEYETRRSRKRSGHWRSVPESPCRRQTTPKKRGRRTAAAQSFWKSIRKRQNISITSCAPNGAVSGWNICAKEN